MELEYEIHEKIDERVKKKKQQDAHLLAQQWLTRIQLFDVPSQSFAGRAAQQLKRRDPKDVPFLALAIQLRSHGILTGDMDFDSQSRVRTFKLGKARRLWYDLSRGSIAICALGATEAVLEVVCRAFLLLLHSFYQLAAGLLKLLLAAAKNAWQLLLKVPFWVWVGLGVVALVSCILVQFNPEAKEWWSSKIDQFKETLYEKTERAISFLAEVEDIVVDMLIVSAPHLQRVLVVYGYLFYTSASLVRRLEELDSGHRADIE